MLWKSHNLHRANLLNTENLYRDSEISLKNMPENVVSFGRRSLAMQFDGIAWFRMPSVAEAYKLLKTSLKPVS